ncbi:zf-CCHC domain-containing protein [Tanacetum coccineum]
MAKDIWKSLLITHQGNSQVKDNKIDLLVQQYEEFTILEEESIDSSFARFNTIITSLKALDEALDELIGNVKVHEVVMEKNYEIHKGKKERVKSITLEAKKESGNAETLTSRSDDEEYAMVVRNFKKFFRMKGRVVKQPRKEKKSFWQMDDKKGKSDRKCFRCGNLNHLIGECPKPPRNKDQKSFVEGCWSDRENEVEDKAIDETCLMAQSSNVLTLDSSLCSDNASSFDDDSMKIEYDNLCEISLKIINKNKILKTKRELLEKEILELNEKIKKLERNKEVGISCESCQQLHLENAELEETQVKFVKFDKSAISLREILNVQKTPSCKIGLGFDKSKASTSGIKPMSFVGSTADLAGDGSTIPGFIDLSTSQKVVCLRTCLELDEWIKDSGFSKHMTGNKSLFFTYKAYDREHVDNLALNLLSVSQICDNKCRALFMKDGSQITKDGKIIGKTPYEIYRGRKASLEYFKNSKGYIILNKHSMEVKETLNVTFNKSPPPTKLSPLVDDDVGEEEAIKNNTKVVNNNNIEDESIEVDEVVNIKESKSHPLEQVIGNLNQRMLRSQA